MRWPRKCRPPEQGHPPAPNSGGVGGGRLALGCLLLLAALPHGTQAAPPAARPAASTRASAPLPDYGGRDAPAVPADAGAEAVSPAAQAGRTLGALVVVLAGVVGVVTLLKRAGFVGGDPATALLGAALRRPAPSAAPFASPALAVTQSQALPGGGTLHLVVAHDKTLLVGATAQGVTLLAEWELAAATPDEARAEDAAFADYLARAGVAQTSAEPSAAVRAAGARVAGAAGRLQDLLARAQSPEEAPR